jgi:hypothetical protein
MNRKDKEKNDLERAACTILASSSFLLRSRKNENSLGECSPNTPKLESEDWTMDNEKRMADHYEIISAFRIGDKEVVFGQDKNCDEPYFCALYEKEVVLCYTRERYEDCYTGDDYIAMMELYADRIRDQCRQVREEWDKVTVPRDPITAEMCLANDYHESIKGKVVAVKLCMLRPEYRSADHQLIYVTGGFGAEANARGNACFCVNLYTGEETRWERFELQGVVKPECVPEWAKKRLEIVLRELEERARRARVKEER